VNQELASSKKSLCGGKITKAPTHLRFMEWMPQWKIVLASKSPRRHQLLQGLDVPFTVRTMEVDEVFPEHLQREEIPLYLSQLKAEAFKPTLAADELVITADTVVWVNNTVLNKPTSAEEAATMLRQLSANTHQVYTAVTLTSAAHAHSFFDTTNVSFRPLSEREIDYYVEKYQPYDKAGAYGAQEWIGYIGMDRLEGSYFNVMGLPVHKLYVELLKFPRP
jgi:septum formation protein